MTHAAELITEPAGRAEPSRPASRAVKFDQARRHSRRVGRLKIVILVSSGLGLVGLALVGLYDPFRKIPGNLSIAGAALNGTKVTMEHPKLTGFRRDGRPYQLLAASGVQDIKKPTIVELNQIDATVTMPDNSTLRLRAPAGVYDTAKDFMSIPRDVRVASTSGYDARLESADFDFKAGTIVSKDPVAVTTASSTITANGLSISGNGSDIVFAGHVRSIVTPASGEAAGRK